MPEGMGKPQACPTSRLFETGSDPSASFPGGADIVWTESNACAGPDRGEPDEQVIFHAARRIAAPEQRQAYLESACGDEPGLRARVEALLRIHDEEQTFLRSPIEGH